MRDETLRPIIHILQNATEQPKTGRMRDYRIKNGILMRCKHNRAQIIVPSRLQSLVLHDVHDAETAGHLGIRKTFDKLIRKYYWTSCHKDTVEYCKTCEVCQKRNNPSTTARAPMISIPVHRAFQRVAIDIVGPFRPTKRGNTHILTCMEYLTKWPEAIPLSDTKTVSVARVLVSLFCRLGFSNRSAVRSRS
jgi:hypothetical protein